MVNKHVCDSKLAFSLLWTNYKNINEFKRGDVS